MRLCWNQELQVQILWYFIEHSGFWASALTNFLVLILFAFEDKLNIAQVKNSFSFWRERQNLYSVFILSLFWHGFNAWLLAAPLQPHVLYNYRHVGNPMVKTGEAMDSVCLLGSAHDSVGETWAVSETFAAKSFSN